MTCHGRAASTRRRTADRHTDVDAALEVTFLDVGHGCCTIIATPRSRSVIMVDCKSGAGPSALRYLRDRGLDDPSAFFVSHLHDDHVAGFADVFRKLAERGVHVKRVYANYVGKTTWKRSRRGGQAVVDQMRDLLDSDESRLHDFRSSERAWQTDGVTFRVLHPGKLDLHEHQDRDDMLNELSGVLRVDFGQSSVLLPGDIEGWAASKLVRTARDDLRSSIFLFPHHGAGWEHTGPSGSPLVAHNERIVPPSALVRAVAPTWTVISVGSDNDGNWLKWRHPSASILDHLRRWHATPPGEFICTEATPHCADGAPGGAQHVQCGGHIRFRLYRDGSIDLNLPDRVSWRDTIARFRSPQCVPPDKR